MTYTNHLPIHRSIATQTIHPAMLCECWRCKPCSLRWGPASAFVGLVHFGSWMLMDRETTCGSNLIQHVSDPSFAHQNIHSYVVSRDVKGGRPILTIEWCVPFVWPQWPFRWCVITIIWPGQTATKRPTENPSSRGLFSKCDDLEVILMYP